MAPTNTPQQSGAYAAAADLVNEAAEAIAEAERLLTAANVILTNRRAWRGQGDVESAIYRLGDQGDEEFGTLADGLTSLAITLHQQAQR